MPRVLSNIDVSFISLVAKGANKKTLIYKSDSETAPVVQKVVQIKKMDEELRTVYCIVYSPDQVDTQGDTANAEEIRKASETFMKAGRTQNIDKQHDFVAGHGFVSENWITKSSDPIFTLEPVGSWAVGIKIENDETWEQIKKGEITGISMAAICEVEDSEEATDTTKSATIKKEGVMKKFAEIIKGMFQGKVAVVQKDFNSEVQAREVNSLIYALERVVYDIYEDSSIEDKKAAVIESIDQLKSAVAVVKFDQTPVEKAGKAISAKNMEFINKIKECHKAMGEHLGSLSPEEETEPEGEKTPIQKADNSNNINNNSSEVEMKPEEVQKMVDEAVAPIKAENTALKSEIETLKSEKASLEKSLNDRVEKIEKAAGSQQGIPAGGGANSGGGSGSGIWV